MEQLTVAQLVNKSQASMELVVYYRVHVLQVLDTVLFRMNPSHTVIHFNIILPPR